MIRTSRIRSKIGIYQKHNPTQFSVAKLDNSKKPAKNFRN